MFRVDSFFKPIEEIGEPGTEDEPDEPVGASPDDRDMSIRSRCRDVNVGAHICWSRLSL